MTFSLKYDRKNELWAPLVRYSVENRCGNRKANVGQPLRALKRPNPSILNKIWHFLIKIWPISSRGVQLGRTRSRRHAYSSLGVGRDRLEPSWRHKIARKAKKWHFGNKMWHLDIKIWFSRNLTEKIKIASTKKIFYCFSIGKRNLPRSPETVYEKNRSKEPLSYFNGDFSMTAQNRGSRDRDVTFY